MNVVTDIEHRRARREQMRLNLGDVRGDRSANSDLPIVKVVASELPRAVDESEEILLESGVPVFTRAGTLVRPIVESVPGPNGSMIQVARLRQLCADSLSDLLAQTMRFQRFDERRRSWANVDPPAKVAAILLSREGKWQLPPIAGIITTPTLRPDGSLLSEPGYDPTTRLYLMPDEALKLPPIPERPGREEAEQALALLYEPLAGFPFVGPVDRAVALSAVLTALLRPALGVAPAHAIAASTPGTGKSYLVDVASTIATGRPCAVIPVGKTEEETEKRLGALLLDGAPLISIDNVNGELGGDMLCQMTERPLVRVRILGRSEMPEVECRSTIFATGNNLTMVGDMTRRAVLCTLDAKVERPELRAFGFDPVAHVLRDRGALVAAAITLVRAYRAAGSPSVCGPLGSYGAWSDTVRSSLIWLGEADPVASMDVMREEDPDLAVIGELFANWRDHLFPGSPYTAVEVEAVASDRLTSGDYLRPGFRDVLMRKAGAGPVVSTRRLGAWLKAIRGRVHNGWYLDMISDEKRGHRYLLVQTKTSDPSGVG